MKTVLAAIDRVQSVDGSVGAVGADKRTKDKAGEARGK